MQRLYARPGSKNFFSLSVTDIKPIAESTIVFFDARNPHVRIVDPCGQIPPDTTSVLVEMWGGRTQASVRGGGGGAGATFVSWCWSSRRSNLRHNRRRSSVDTKVGGTTTVKGTGHGIPYEMTATGGRSARGRHGGAGGAGKAIIMASPYWVKLSEWRKRSFLFVQRGTRRRLLLIGGWFAALENRTLTRSRTNSNRDFASG